jgi:hypothetical protein
MELPPAVKIAPKGIVLTMYGICQRIVRQLIISVFYNSYLLSSSTVRKSLERSSDGGPKTALDIDYSLPLTTTIKRMRNAGFVYNVMGDSLIAPTACLGFDGQDVDEVNTKNSYDNNDIQYKYQRLQPIPKSRSLLSNGLFFSHESNLSLFLILRFI